MAGGRTEFSSKLGVIAATVGSAVGLGNIWRFPYEAGTHGGGAFLICYIFFVLVIGVPVICAEFTMGRASRLGIPGAFRYGHNSRKWEGIGYLGILAAILILGFYSVVAGWTFEYIIESVSGAFQDTTADERHIHFEDFISGWRAVGWTICFLIINAIVSLGGVQKGIERVSNILMPLLFLILLAFCINSAFLPGFNEGVSFLFHPDFSKLTPDVILSALGQAFFSLSLGMGCLVTYSSYFSDRTPLVKTAAQIAVLDTLVAILSGLVIFPAVFSFGMSPAEGPTLVFEVLPGIFNLMPGGMIWSTLFFLLLAVASLTSIISVSEIVVTFLSDEFKISRVKSTVSVTSITLVTSTLCSLSFGPLKWLNLFNIFDYVSSNILMTLGGLGVCIFVGWRMSPADAREELHGKAGVPMWLYSTVMFIIKYLAPVCIGIVFIAGLL